MTSKVAVAIGVVGESLPGEHTVGRCEGSLA